jgi:hypothetical protein
MVLSDNSIVILPCPLCSVAYIGMYSVGDLRIFWNRAVTWWPPVNVRHMRYYRVHSMMRFMAVDCPIAQMLDGEFIHARINDRDQC